MSFDSKGFKKAKFEPRVEGVSVPDLREYYSEGTDAVWLVRGLTGHELGQVNESAQRARNMDAAIEALVSDKASDKCDAIRALIGVDGSTPVDIVRRIEMLRIGSVDPVCDQDLSVKLCTHFPVEFMQITNKITELTGKGAEVKKKPMPSGAVTT